MANWRRWQAPPPPASDNRWVLFNDFSLSHVPPASVRDFRALWRQPCAVVFARVATTQRPSVQVEPVTVSMNQWVYRPLRSLSRARPGPATFTSLHPSEPMTKGGVADHWWIAGWRDVM